MKVRKGTDVRISGGMRMINRRVFDSYVIIIMTKLLSRTAKSGAGAIK
jgi:hypothetical protein